MVTATAKPYAAASRSLDRNVTIKIAHAMPSVTLIAGTNT